MCIRLLWHSKSEKSEAKATNGLLQCVRSQMPFIVKKDLPGNYSQR